MNIVVPVELLQGNRLNEQYDKLPSWLQIALKEVGVKEFSNGSNPKIEEYQRLSKVVGFAGQENDDIPWCAFFANYCLEQSNISGTKSAMAKSFMKWGIALLTPQLGSIVVFDRGSNPALGHVGFFMGFDKDGSVRTLGGNQSNAVTISSFNPRTVRGYRWPMAESDLMFNVALAQVLKWEAKGFIDDPKDLGGATYRGITLETLMDFYKKKNWDIDQNTALNRMTKGLFDNELNEIYYEMYWRRAECHKLPPVLSFFHFDTAVLQGPITAIKLLQEALSVDVDGEVGPLTLNAAYRSDGFGDMLDRYKNLRELRFRHTATADVHLDGWLNRLNDVYKETLKYLTGAKPMPPEQPQPIIPPGVPHVQPQPVPMDAVGALAASLAQGVVGQLAPMIASLAQSYAQQTALLQGIQTTLSRIEAKLSQPAVPTSGQPSTQFGSPFVPQLPLGLPIPGLPLGGALVVPLVNALLGRITEELNRR